MGSSLFFSLSLVAALVMLVEGCMIVLLKKQITPLPTRILMGLSVLVVGKAKSRPSFSGRTSLHDLRAYAIYTLIFGALLLVSSFIYLFTQVL